jgi:hypothetical protein
MRDAAELFAGQLGLDSAGEAVRELQRRSLEWGSIERRLLPVDLWSVQPFSPYDVKVEKADQRAALNELAAALDARGAVAEIDRCAREIRNSTRFKSALKVGGAVAAGSVVMAGTGFVAAPFIGAALGASMGLSGAAATSAGLAALGGGSLAAGGAGVAGGMAVVATAGARESPQSPTPARSQHSVGTRWPSMLPSGRGSPNSSPIMGTEGALSTSIPAPSSRGRDERTLVRILLARSSLRAHG